MAQSDSTGILTVNKNKQTINDVLQQAFTQYGNNKAFTCMGKTLSYNQVDQLSSCFASYLQNHTKLKPGDRIAIQLPNILQYPVAMYGAIKAGLVVVNTNPLYTARELKHQLNDSGAKALVVLANTAEAASKIVGETQVEQVIVTQLGDLHSPIKKTLINFAVKHIKKLVPDYHFYQEVKFTETLKQGSSFNAVNVNVEDVAVLQYTGGTTGVAKGAMLTHNNLVSNMYQLLDRIDETLGTAKTMVAPLPLYHIYAFTSNLMAMPMTGNHNLLIPNPRDIPAFVKALKSETVSGFVGINTLFNALCRDENFRQLDFSELTMTASGGMALTDDAAQQWQTLTGVEPSEGYGLTETSPVVSSNPADAIQRGTVGLPVVGTEVKVIDDNGQDLVGGEAGELCVRGPQVMKGYWQRPEATAEVMTDDGWFKTGDVAVIQADGYIKIVDRKKDMIIVSGFNVYPNEVEDVACLHPDIVEAAAIGLEDPKTGEAVKLFLVKSNPNLTEKDVKDHCYENLTAYKVPKLIEFRDDLPKSAVGKILRKELR